jgi:hypothetical protein
MGRLSVLLALIFSSPPAHRTRRRPARVLYGKGVPATVASGRASAAVKETIPRMPVQPMMSRCDQGGIGSRARNAGLTERGTQAATGTYIRRATMAVKLTSAPIRVRGLNLPGEQRQKAVWGNWSLPSCSS